MITSAKWQQLTDRMNKLGVTELEIQEKFILGSGHGGQKINKTSSCVYLKHVPTGIEIKCQESRFRDENRYHARRRLCEKIEEMKFAEQSEKQQAISKLRRQKKRRSRKAKLKMLEAKSQRGAIKKLRRTPGAQD